MVTNLRIIGRDFSELSKAGFFPNDLLPENEKGVFLKQFLDSIDVGSLCVNECEKPDLHSVYKDMELFGGVVGVVSKTFTYAAPNLAEQAEQKEFHVTLEIHSRFDNEKPYFLATMLSECEPIISNNLVLSNDDDHFFDFLLLFRYKQLFKEAYLKGYYRTYHTFRNNDSRLKGTIDIARHIRLNAGQDNGKIAYSYREKSVDNYLNHLLVAAYYHLKKKHPELVWEFIEADAEFRETLDGLRYSVCYPKYSLHTLIGKNETPISHPYYSEYEQLRKVCLLILRDEGTSIFDGNRDGDMQGILWYIPTLWEKFLEQRVLPGAEYFLETQFPVETFDYGDEKYKHKTFPDFVFFATQNNANPFLILDAKFKPDWGDTVLSRHSITGKLDADFTKCLRDMTTLCIHAAGTVFPVSLPVNTDSTKYPEDNILTHRISSYNEIDRFYTFPVFVPPAEGLSYTKWQREFNTTVRTASARIQEKATLERRFCESVRVEAERMRSERRVTPAIGLSVPPH